MTSLIARLQAATEPDRELDLAISMAVNYRGMFGKTDWKFNGEPNEIRSPTGGILCARQFVPYWTESIDAALGLVPDGAEWELTTIYHIAQCEVGLNNSDGVTHTGRRKDMNCALAICEAALKARGVE